MAMMYDANTNKLESRESQRVDDIEPWNDDSFQVSNKKILNITSGTTGIDIHEILAKLVQYTNMADALAHVEKTLEYVVQIPLKYQPAVQSGEMFINQSSKTGVMWPTLYRILENGKRQFVDNLPIKPKEIIQGNPFENIATSYHNLYIQQQFSELSEIMSQTYRVVERIEQGQLDDRIGSLLAGRDQILHATSFNSGDRANEIAHGRNSMLVAQRQLLQTLKRRINNFKPIPASQWKRFRTELIHSGSLLFSVK